MTLCRNQHATITTLSQINLVRGISSQSILTPLSYYPSLTILLGTVLTPLLFTVLESMFLCIVYANAFQRPCINNTVYNVKYFYLAFTSSGVIFLKQSRYCNNFKMFPKVWERTHVLPTLILWYSDGNLLSMFLNMKVGNRGSTLWGIKWQ